MKLRAKAAKPLHLPHQLGEGVRHLERYRQQRHRERKHGVAQALDAGDLVAAPAEALLDADAFLDQTIAEHARIRSGPLEGVWQPWQVILSQPRAQACQRQDFPRVSHAIVLAEGYDTGEAAVKFLRMDRTKR